MESDASGMADPVIVTGMARDPVPAEKAGVAMLSKPMRYPRNEALTSGPKSAKIKVDRGARREEL